MAEEEHGSAVTPLTQIEDAIISIINDNENKGKITYLGELGSRLNDRFTDFDVRNYGYSKLTPFIKSLGNYETGRIPTGSGGRKQIYFRMKEDKQ